ncbi:hypothetical protein HYH03_001722 [Edaphochlamys debaryana]|uniref:Uncharacterized protein n=1 Tax=Edaphochlamys debaryana TaxID=47281 RepID=A0A836C4R8_9CHLO|nr:hypothetical protein HYH03_001722 [Edaphochlamys debaryana]|eukprot:KAG2500140.1 hypothetical protein HYH03_001722 [Edaphochlamys debaryana]
MATARARPPPQPPPSGPEPAPLPPTTSAAGSRCEPSVPCVGSGCANLLRKRGAASNRGEASAARAFAPAHLLDVLLLLAQLLLVPASNLSRVLALRAGRDAGSGPADEAAPLGAAGSSSGRVGGGAAGPQPAHALWLGGYDADVLRSFPCGASGLGRAVYALRRGYPHLALPWLATVDASTALYAGALAVGALLLAAQHLSTYLRLRRALGGRSGMAAATAAAAVGAAAAEAAQAQHRVLQHCVVAAVRMSMQLGNVVSPLMLWRRLGRPTAATLLPLTPGIHYLPGARHRGCAFIAIAAVTTCRLPLSWQLPVSLAELALVTTHMAITDTVMYGAPQRPLAAACTAAACVLLLPALLMYATEGSVRQARRGAQQVAATAVSVWRSPPTSPLKKLLSPRRLASPPASLPHFPAAAASPLPGAAAASAFSPRASAPARPAAATPAAASPFMPPPRLGRIGALLSALEAADSSNGDGGDTGSMVPAVGSSRDGAGGLDLSLGSSSAGAVRSGESGCNAWDDAGSGSGSGKEEEAGPMCLGSVQGPPAAAAVPRRPFLDMRLLLPLTPQPPPPAAAAGTAAAPGASSVPASPLYVSRLNSATVSLKLQFHTADVAGFHSAAAAASAAAAKALAASGAAGAAGGAQPCGPYRRGLVGCLGSVAVRGCVHLIQVVRTARGRLAAAPAAAAAGRCVGPTGPWRQAGVLPSCNAVSELESAGSGSAGGASAALAEGAGADVRGIQALLLRLYDACTAAAASGTDEEEGAPAEGGRAEARRTPPASPRRLAATGASPPRPPATPGGEAAGDEAGTAGMAGAGGGEVYEEEMLPAYLATAAVAVLPPPLEGSADAAAAAAAEAEVEVLLAPEAVAAIALLQPRAGQQAAASAVHGLRVRVVAAAAGAPGLAEATAGGEGSAPPAGGAVGAVLDEVLPLKPLRRCTSGSGSRRTAEGEWPAAVVRVAFPTGLLTQPPAVLMLHLLPPPPEGEGQGSDAAASAAAATAPAGGGRSSRVLASLPLLVAEHPAAAAELSALYDASAAEYDMFRVGRSTLSACYSRSRLQAYQGHMAELIADVALLLQPPLSPTAGPSAAAAAQVELAAITGSQLLAFMRGQGMAACAALVAAALQERWGLGPQELTAAAGAEAEELFVGATVAVATILPAPSPPSQAATAPDGAAAVLPAAVPFPEPPSSAELPRDKGLPRPGRLPPPHQPASARQGPGLLLPPSLPDPSVAAIKHALVTPGVPWYNRALLIAFLAPALGPPAVLLLAPRVYAAHRTALVLLLWEAPLQAFLALVSCGVIPSCRRCISVRHHIVHMVLNLFFQPGLLGLRPSLVGLVLTARIVPFTAASAVWGQLAPACVAASGVAGVGVGVATAAFVRAEAHARSRRSRVADSGGGSSGSAAPQIPLTAARVAAGTAALCACAARSLHDFLFLLAQLLLVPASNLSRFLALRAGCDAGSGPADEAAPLGAAGSSSGRVGSGAAGPQPAHALWLGGYDADVLRSFPCGASGLGRAAYALRRGYALLALPQVATVDASSALYTGALAVGALLLAAQHLSTYLRLRRALGGRSGMAAATAAAAVGAAAAEAAQAQHRVLQHCVVAAVRMSMQLGKVVSPLMLWRRLGRSAAAALLPLTPAAYYLPGGRHRGCAFVPMVAVTTGRLPLSWQLPVSLAELALVITHMAITDTVMYGAPQRPLATACTAAACVLLLPALLMYATEGSVRQARRGPQQVAAAAVSVWRSPPTSPLKKLLSPRRLATPPTSPSVLAADASPLPSLPTTGGRAGDAEAATSLPVTVLPAEAAAVFSRSPLETANQSGDTPAVADAAAGAFASAEQSYSGGGGPECIANNPFPYSRLDSLRSLLSTVPAAAGSSRNGAASDGKLSRGSSIAGGGADGAASEAESDHGADSGCSVCGGGGSDSDDNEVTALAAAAAPATAAAISLHTKSVPLRTAAAPRLPSLDMRLLLPRTTLAAAADSTSLGSLAAQGASSVPASPLYVSRLNSATVSLKLQFHTADVAGFHSAAAAASAAAAKALAASGAAGAAGGAQPRGPYRRGLVGCLGSVAVRGCVHLIQVVRTARGITAPARRRPLLTRALPDGDSGQEDRAPAGGRVIHTAVHSLPAPRSSAPPPGDSGAAGPASAAAAPRGWQSLGASSRSSWVAGPGARGDLPSRNVMSEIAPAAGDGAAARAGAGAGAPAEAGIQALLRHLYEHVAPVEGQVAGAMVAEAEGGVAEAHRTPPASPSRLAATGASPPRPPATPGGEAAGNEAGTAGMAGAGGGEVYEEEMLPAYLATAAVAVLPPPLEGSADAAAAAAAEAEVEVLLAPEAVAAIALLQPRAGQQASASAVHGLRVRVVAAAAGAPGPAEAAEGVEEDGEDLPFRGGSGTGAGAVLDEMLPLKPLRHCSGGSGSRRTAEGEWPAAVVRVALPASLLTQPPAVLMIHLLPPPEGEGQGSDDDASSSAASAPAGGGRSSCVLASLPLLVAEQSAAAELSALYDACAAEYDMLRVGRRRCDRAAASACYNRSRQQAYQDHVAELIADVALLLQPPLAAAAAGSSAAAAAQVELAAATGSQLLAFMGAQGMAACGALVAAALQERWGWGPQELTAAAPDTSEIAHDSGAHGTPSPQSQPTAQAPAVQSLSLGLPTPAIETALPPPPFPEDLRLLHHEPSSSVGPSATATPTPEGKPGQGLAPEAGGDLSHGAPCACRLLRSDGPMWGVLLLKHILMMKHLLLNPGLPPAHRKAMFAAFLPVALGLPAVLLLAPRLYAAHRTALVLLLWEAPTLLYLLFFQPGLLGLHPSVVGLMLAARVVPMLAARVVPFTAASAVIGRLPTVWVATWAMLMAKNEDDAKMGVPGLAASSDLTSTGASQDGDLGTLTLAEGAAVLEGSSTLEAAFPRSCQTASAGETTLVQLWAGQGPGSGLPFRVSLVLLSDNSIGLEASPTLISTLGLQPGTRLTLRKDAAGRVVARVAGGATPVSAPGLAPPRGTAGRRPTRAKAPLEPSASGAEGRILSPRLPTSSAPATRVAGMAGADGATWLGVIYLYNNSTNNLYFTGAKDIRTAFPDKVKDVAEQMTKTKVEVWAAQSVWGTAADAELRPYDIILYQKPKVIRLTEVRNLVDSLGIKHDDAAELWRLRDGRVEMRPLDGSRPSHPAAAAGSSSSSGGSASAAEAAEPSPTAPRAPSGVSSASSSAGGGSTDDPSGGALLGHLKVYYKDNKMHFTGSEVLRSIFWPESRGKPDNGDIGCVTLLVRPGGAGEAAGAGVDQPHTVTLYNVSGGLRLSGVAGLSKTLGGLEDGQRLALWRLGGEGGSVLVTRASAEGQKR